MALMVRVGAESREQALREPHVRPMLFAGRALSGFICIEPAFPRERFVKNCTKRFRGNVTDVAARSMTIRADALSAADADIHPKGDDV